MKIAILSKGAANYSTKRLKEEALKRGHEVRVINYAKCYVSVEKNSPVVHYKGEPLTGFDAVIPRIAASYTKYGTAMVRQFEMPISYSPRRELVYQKLCLRVKRLILITSLKWLAVHRW